MNYAIHKHMNYKDLATDHRRRIADIITGIGVVLFAFGVYYNLAYYLHSDASVLLGNTLTLGYYMLVARFAILRQWLVFWPLLFVGLSLDLWLLYPVLLQHKP